MKRLRIVLTAITCCFCIGLLVTSVFASVTLSVGMSASFVFEGASQVQILGSGKTDAFDADFSLTGYDSDLKGFNWEPFQYIQDCTYYFILFSVTNRGTSSVTVAKPTYTSEIYFHGIEGERTTLLTGTPTFYTATSKLASAGAWSTWSGGVSVGASATKYFMIKFTKNSSLPTFTESARDYWNFTITLS